MKNIYTLRYFCLSVGYYCGKDCIFCNEGGKGFRKNPFVRGNKVDLEKFRDFILYLKKNGFKKVSIGGGEPMNLDNLEDIIKFLKDNGFIVLLVTSGRSRFSESKVYNVVSSGIDSIMFSFHGLDRNINKFITGGDFLKQELQHIYYFSSHKKKFKYDFLINQVVLRVNFSMLYKDIIFLLNNFNIDLYHLQDLEPVGKGRDIYNDQHVPYTDIAKFIKFLDDKTGGKYRKKIKVRVPYCLLSSELYEYVSDRVDNNILLDRNYPYKKCKKCIYKDKCWGFLKYNG